MTLKNVLLINAISSGVTGALLVLIPGIVSTLFKAKSAIPFVGVGVFLLLFSLFVLLTAFKNAIQKNWTKLIIGLDIAWVMVSIIATVLLFSSVSIAGSAIILAVAAWVGLMAYLQHKTLYKI